MPEGRNEMNLLSLKHIVFAKVNGQIDIPVSIRRTTSQLQSKDGTKCFIGRKIYGAPAAKTA